MQQEHTWQMPDWWCRERKPQNDNVYFENMCRVIFEAGLNWQVIDDKWAATRKAFSNFEVNRVASFTNSDVQRLLNDAGIVRNKSKIEGIIKNAKRFQVIEKVFGGFRGYIDSLDKSNNYAAAVKDLTSKFERLGPSSATLYLYTVGEDIKPF